MYTRHHLVLSVLAGAAAVPVLAPPPGPVAFIAWAAVVGTLIDLDHFLIARARTGSWRALRVAVTTPRVGLIRQADLFEAGEVGAWHRLVSHLVLAGALTAALVPVSVSLAVGTAVVLYVHLLSDAVWELRRVSEGAARSRS